MARYLVALLLLACSAVAPAVEVVLVDGRELSGRIEGETDTAIVLRSGRKRMAIPRRAIHEIYENAKALEEAKATEPFFVLRRAFATITLEEEAAARASETAMVAGEGGDGDHLPPAARVRRWREVAESTPRGRPKRVRIPWMGDAKRGTAFVGVPEDYDPANPHPLVVALHGTEDDP